MKIEATIDRAPLQSGLRNEPKDPFPFREMYLQFGIDQTDELCARVKEMGERADRRGIYKNAWKFRSGF